MLSMDEEKNSLVAGIVSNFIRLGLILYKI